MREVKVFGVFCCLLVFSVFCHAKEKVSNEGYALSKTTYQFVGFSIVVEVGEKTITQNQLYQELYRLYGENVLPGMIENLIIEQEAESRNLKIKSDEIDKETGKIKAQFNAESDFERFLKNQKMDLEIFKQQIVLNLLKRKMLIKDKGIKVGKKEVKVFFEANKTNFNVPLQIKIKHILVRGENEAQDVFIALQAGADFSKMAKLKSIDTASREKSGDLGTFSRGMLIPEFEERIFNLSTNEISPPFKTRLGWHVVKIIEKIEPKEAKLDKKLRGKIKESLIIQSINKDYPQWISELSKKWIISR